MQFFLVMVYVCRMKQIRMHTLPNGLCILHDHVPDSLVVHCGLLVGAGTRDETAGREGLAHFVEHCLFKGTKKRRSYHILNRLEVVGGELNAYTTKEETCLHASVIPDYFERALELIADLAFNSVFPDKELEKEKDVITDEISAYLDTPYEQIFDDFEGMVFKGHPLGHPILGKETSIRAFRKKHLLEFIKTNYHPERMVFAVSGPMSFDQAVKCCERHLSRRGRSSPKPDRKPVKRYQPDIADQQRNVSQAHYIMGRPSYGLRSPQRFTMVLLNNLLGGPGMNSLLNLHIREKYGITYTIETGYHTYTDNGIFHMYFATDGKNVERTLKLVEKEFSRLVDRPLSSRQLHQYKEQLIGQIRLAQENRLSVLLSMAKSRLNLGRIIQLEEITASIREVTAPMLQKVAAEMLGPEGRTVLMYSPVSQV